MKMQIEEDEVDLVETLIESKIQEYKDKKIPVEMQATFLAPYIKLYNDIQALRSTEQKKKSSEPSP